MAATIASCVAVGKKIKISKNRKKYWKKHVNLQDVEEYLEEKRQDERFGGAVQDKADQQLFLVDSKGNSDQKPLLRSHLSQLKCFQILQPDSAIPPPVKPPQLQGKQKPKLKALQSVPADRKLRTRKQRTPEENKKGEKKQNNPYDLWSTDVNNIKKKPVANVDVGYLPESVTRTTIKVPEYRYQKPSLLPAVETPHPGASYNPRFTDHQDLLWKAHQVEKLRQKEEDHLDRCLTQKFPKELPTEEMWLKEMSAGLFDGDEKQEEDEENEKELPSEGKTWGQPVSFLNRKTKADRNLDKVRNREKRKVFLEKLEKRRLNDFNGLKAVKRKIVKAEAESEVRKKKREEKESESMYHAKRLGPCKYVAPDLEIQLGEELPDNLRTLKMEGHLMDDRFKSFQRRNLIEPRIRQKSRKKKMKVFVKRSHRN